MTKACRISSLCLGIWLVKISVDFTNHGQHYIINEIKLNFIKNILQQPSGEIFDFLQI